LFTAVLLTDDKQLSFDIKQQKPCEQRLTRALLPNLQASKSLENSSEACEKTREFIKGLIKLFQRHRKIRTAFAQSQSCYCFSPTLPLTKFWNNDIPKQLSFPFVT